MLCGTSTGLKQKERERETKGRTIVATKKKRRETIETHEYLKNIDDSLLWQLEGWAMIDTTPKLENKC